MIKLTVFYVFYILISLNQHLQIRRFISLIKIEFEQEYSKVKNFIFGLDLAHLIYGTHNLSPNLNLFIVINSPSFRSK